MDDNSEMSLPDSEDKIEITIKSHSDMPELKFKTKATHAFARMFEIYHKRSSAEPGTIRFIFDGQRIGASQTPKDLDMQNEDIIDAVIQQVGGYLT
jgi:hypothetical protein